MCYSRSQSFVEIRDSSVQILRVTLYKVQKKDDYQEIKSYNLEYKDLKDRMITIMTNDTQVVTRMPSDTVYLGIGISDEKGQKNFFINASKEPLSFD
jgi:NADH:ubiquinone oxidoreductase subunit D